MANSTRTSPRWDETELSIRGMTLTVLVAVKGRRLGRTESGPTTGAAALHYEYVDEVLGRVVVRR